MRKNIFRSLSAIVTVSMLLSGQPVFYASAEDALTPDSYAEGSDNDAEEVFAPDSYAEDYDNATEDAVSLSETETEESDTEAVFENDTPDISNADPDFYKSFQYYLDNEHSRLYLHSLISDDITEVEIPSTAEINGSSYTVWLRERTFLNKTNLKKVTIHDGVYLANGYYLFKGCTGLEELDLSGLNTHNAISMSGMFSECNSLRDLDLSGFDTSNVTNMNAMFNNCNALKSLALSGFNTTSVTDMAFMFRGCNSLENLDLSGFDTSNVTTMRFMFNECSALKSLAISGFNTTSVTDMAAMFCECNSLENLDLSSFDTSNVTYMNSMFYNCKTLKSLDLSGFNTMNVIHMESMFNFCSLLEELDVSGFDTTNVTSMCAMFQFCSSLEKLDVSGFNTKNVTDMGCLFNICSSLNELDVSGFDTGNVIDMRGMFNSCSSLEKLDVSSFNTESVTNMHAMFSNCSLLNELDVSGFDTTNVTDMSYMFNLCDSLEKLNLSGINTQNVTTMEYMFFRCESLKKLDLSNFDMAKVSSGINMLGLCPSLSYIKTPVNVSADISISLPQPMLDQNAKSYSSLPNGTDSSKSIELAVNWDRLPLSVTQADGVYGTQLSAPVYDNPEAGGDVSISYTGTLLKDGSVYGPADVAPSLPGSYTVSVTYRTSGLIYAGDADFVIKKADWADKNIQIHGTAVNDGSCDLKNNIAENGIPGSIIVISGGEQLDGSLHISSGSILEWKIKETVKNVNVTLRIPVTGADNYNDYIIFVTLSASAQNEKQPLTISQADGVYGIPLSSPEYEKPDADGTETISYSGTLSKDNSEYGPTADAPALPGTYIINITYEAGDAVYAGSAGFVIKKAECPNKVVYVRGSSVEDGRVDLEKRIVENASLGEIKVAEGNEQLEGLPRITGGTLLEWKIKNNVEDKDIKIVLNIPVTGADNYNDYLITVNILGEPSVPAAEEITINGNKVSSLKEAFSRITDPNMDYVINIGLDIKEDKNLTIPKAAKSVTIIGNGHTLELSGSKITANAPLSIEGINIKALKKNGDASKLTLLSKKDLRIGENTGIDSAGTTVKSSGDFVLSGSFHVDKVTAGNLTLESGAELMVLATGSIIVNGVLKGNGGAIKLAQNFYKPIKLKGTVEGVVYFTGAKQTDGTQLISCSSKKIGANLLRKCFDVSAVTDNAVDTYLYYFSNGKAVIFGEAISYNGVKYGVWKDVVTAMNADLKVAKAAKKEISFEIELSGDVYVNGNFKLPSKGYKNITVHGNGHIMTFTGNIKLTGNTVFDELILNKVDKKGNKKAGKVITGKYTYTGPETF